MNVTWTINIEFSIKNETIVIIHKGLLTQRKMIQQRQNPEHIGPVLGIDLMDDLKI